MYVLDLLSGVDLRVEMDEKVLYIEQNLDLKVGVIWRRLKIHHFWV